MTKTSIKRICAVAAFTLGAAGMSQAEPLLAEGGWSGRGNPASQMSDVVVIVNDSDPVLTTAALPPRRPKNLGAAAPKPTRAVVAEPLPVRAISVAALPKKPLFWMTVGNGF